MQYKLLKTKEQYDVFQKDTDQRFYEIPSEYPCIAFIYTDDVEVRWNSKGFKLDKILNIKFIYPTQIQKQLYSDDFEEILK